MAVTVVPNLTLVAAGTTAQDAYWSGEDGVTTEVFQQGVSAQSWVVAKNALETAVFDYYTANGNIVANVSTADTHLYMHIRCDIAPFIDYFSVKLTDGSGNWSQWDVVDNTTSIEWYGEWKTFVVDLFSTPDSISGTLVKTDVRTFSFIVDNRNSGNIRSIENTYIDIVRFGQGLTVYDDSLNAFGFAEIEAISNNVTNKYGVIQKIGGIFFIKGRIKIGDKDLFAYDTSFQTNDEVLVFLDPEVSGERFSNTFQGITVQGHKNGLTYFRCGTPVGSGDSLTGRNGTTFMGESGTTPVTFDFPDTTSINAMELFGSLFRNTAGTIDLSGMDYVAGCTFDGCGMISPGETAVFRNDSFLNSIAISTEGAVDWEPSTDIKYAAFTNNINAIYIHTTVASPYTIVGLDFSGNTYDIRYNHTSSVNWNWSESAAAPTINNVSTGVLTAVNTVSLEISSVTATARIYIETLSGGPVGAGTELFNEVSGSTTWSDTYAYTSPQPVVVRVRDASVPGSEKRPFEVNTSITSAGMTLIAVLIDDN